VDVAPEDHQSELRDGKEFASGYLGPLTLDVTDELTGIGVDESRVVIYLVP